MSSNFYFYHREPLLKLVLERCILPAKHGFMEDISQTISALSALAQETRLRAFRALMTAGNDGLSAGLLARQLGIAPNALSTHLTILCHSGLVSVTRKGRYKIYTAQIDAINLLLSSLVETCCQGHPEVCGMLAKLSKPE